MRSRATCWIDGVEPMRSQGYWIERCSNVLKLAVLSSIAAIFSSSVQAQLIPDSSLGLENSTLQLNTVQGQPAQLIQGGARRASNLFHSFEAFNIAEAERVYFANPAGVENILARVIGSTASNISGTLGIDGTASLFLLNPNGVVFGPDARLDVAGSFLATSASAVQFDNQGSFDASDSAVSPLLTVAPSALAFSTASKGSIISRSAQNEIGLNTLPGQSLLLAGGEILVEGGRLTAPGGRVELFSVGDTAQVPLQQVEAAWQFAALPPQTLADITLNDQARIDVRADGGGDVVITARDFTITGEGTEILAGIAEGTSNPIAQSGGVRIQASNVVKVDDGARVDNSIPENAQGNGGPITLEANMIQILNGGLINSEVEGQGSLAPITLKADQVLVDEVKEGRQRNGVFNVVGNGGIGRGGDILIETRSLKVNNGGRFEVSTDGQGDAGTVTINATEEVISSGISEQNRATSGINSIIDRDGEGNTGKIIVNTGQLVLQDGAKLRQFNLGNGFLGGIEINASQDVIIDGIRPSPRGTPSAIISLLRTGSSGRSGDIRIASNSLFVTNGGTIETTATGDGSAGSLTINANQDVVIDGIKDNFPSGLLTAAEQLFFPEFDFIGDVPESSGDIRIAAQNISVTGGARVASNAFRSAGNAGDIRIKAQEQVIVSGTGPSILAAFDASIIEISSGIFAETLGDTDADGGEIQISANRLEVSDSGLISSLTGSRGDGGNIQFNLQKLSILSGGQVVSNTLQEGGGGEIIIRVQDQVEISGVSAGFQEPERSDVQPASPESGIYASALADSTGNGGLLDIAADSIQVSDRGQLSVSSLGRGAAGSVNLSGRTVQIIDQGKLLASTTSTQGGNINLALDETLLLRREARLSATAGTAQAGGDGGNINIRAPFLVSLPDENNDITANAFSGQGGQINIEALAVFGLAPRTRAELEAALGTDEPSQLDPTRLLSNDITAISQVSPSLSGLVTINNLDVDPAESVAELPDAPVDTASLIDQSLCEASEGSSFVATGRGGLQENPVENVRAIATWEDWRINMPTKLDASAQARSEKQAQPPTAHIVATSPPHSSLLEFQEAQGWLQDGYGTVYLSANPSTLTPLSSTLVQPSCRGHHRGPHQAS